MIVFKDRLQKVLMKKRMTQAKLSRLAGIDETTISKWVRGLSTPNIKQLVKACDILNCSADYLIGVSDKTEIYYKVANDSDSYGSFETLEDAIKSLETYDSLNNNGSYYKIYKVIESKKLVYDAKEKMEKKWNL